MARVLVGSVVVSAILSVAIPAFSQAEPPPIGTNPDVGPAPVAPAAAPVAGQPDATAPAGAAPGAPTFPVAATPPPGTQAPAPPPSYPPPTAAAPTYNPPPATPSPRSSAPPPSSAPPSSEDGYNVGPSAVVEPPPPPPPARGDDGDGKGFEFPDMSIRADPLNWLIYGKLGIELEAAVYKFITAEIVPVFVTSTQPPAMNLGSFPATLSQHSNGLGAMSGASIGAGFWLNGNPFRGTVLRFYYTNYGYRYTSTPDAGNGGKGDEASHTERRLTFMIGSHSKWGAFTLASGIGLGYEMNRERRCFPVNYSNIDAVEATKTGCSKDVFEFRLPGRNEPINLYDSLHPVSIEFRLSLGVVF